MSWAVEIEPGLWQGEWPRTPDDVAPWATLVNCCAECPDPAVPGKVWITVPMVDDGQWAPDPVLLTAVVRMVRAAPAPVLVHCGMGRSRSTAVLVAILRDRHRDWDAATAITCVRRVNPEANPNPALWAAVTAWSPPAD